METRRRDLEPTLPREAQVTVAPTGGSDAGAVQPPPSLPPDAAPAVAPPAIDAAPPDSAPVPVDAGPPDAAQKPDNPPVEAKKQLGKLEVRAFPVLTVSLDGKRLGDTPINKMVPISKHTLRLVNTDRNYDEKIPIVITADKTTSIERMK